MTGQILLAWLKLLGLDPAKPSPGRYGVPHAAARLVHGSRKRCLKIQATGLPVALPVLDLSP